MLYKDLVHITYQNFRNRKSRVLFTVLGVAIAIAAVFSLVAFGYGLQRNLLEKITTAESLLSFDVVPADTSIIRLTPDVVRDLSRVEHVAEISPRATFSGEVEVDRLKSVIDLNLVQSNFFVLEGSAPIGGKFFSEGDSGKVVITSVVADLFGLKPEDAIGKRIRLSVFLPKAEDAAQVVEMRLDRDFEILGVVESAASNGEVFLLERDAPEVIISEYRLVKVKVGSSAYMESVREKLLSRGFLVSALSDVIDQANKIFGVVQIALGIFGVIALIVAAIGLINTMTIALLERTNEIGIMRAIGAAPNDIQKIFLGESTLIGFFGGVSGIILGILASEILNASFNLLAVSLGGEAARLFAYPFWFILFIIFLSTLVGFIAGFWPARRAAKMNPMDALKYK